tara:strand:+ start:119 stop:286 length:168 start_codon:yes stop_codon:yes gene_type:complete
MKPYGLKSGKFRWIFDNPTNRSRLMNRNADRSLKKSTRQKLNVRKIQELKDLVYV